MRTKKKSLFQLSSAVLVLFSGLSFPVHAELDMTGLYAGLQYSNATLETKSSTTKTKKDWGHIKGKIGKSLNEYVSLEGQFGMTTNSGSSKGIATYGAYVRAGKDFGQYKLYGLVGFSGYDSYQDNGPDVDESSGSYGLGLEIFGSKNIALTFEYINMVEDTKQGTDFTFDTIGFGFTYYFIEDTSYFNKNRNKIQSIRY